MPLYKYIARSPRPQGDAIFYGVLGGLGFEGFGGFRGLGLGLGFGV